MQIEFSRNRIWDLRTVLAAVFLFGMTCVSVNADDPPPQSPESGEAKAAPLNEDETPQSEKSSDDYYELMRIFVDTFQEIDQNYVKEVDRRKLVNAAVRGMLAELDPYSEYIAPDDLQHFTEAISQEFGGVGIRVNFDKSNRSIEVLTPLPGGPAYKAGLKAGDRIVEIDGKAVKDFPVGKEIDTAIEMLRGQPGEKVEVGVLHPESKDIDKVTLTREKIQLDTVLGDIMDDDGKWNLFIDEENKIGYLRLTHFTSRSAAEMRDALKTLKKQGMKGLIIDLRYNPGGLLEAAVDIADMFITEGLIVSTDGRNSIHRTWTAKSFGTFTGFPIAVLINNYSASASEILSACLQDHKRAVVIGERSWGKGSVQDVIDLEDGKSALKLTTASYHRPSGKNIHRFPNAKESDEWGVTPDEGYKIEYSLKDHQAYQEYRHYRDLPGKKRKDIPFEDRQLDAAKKYILEEISKSSSDADTPTESDDAKPKESEEKKAARGPERFHFLAVPKRRAG
jgi:C-terminal peptidase (prc)